MATSIIRRRTRLAKTAALQKRMRKTMMRNAPRLFAAARPGALPMPADRKLQAFTPASVLARYGDTAAGARAVATGDSVIPMFDRHGEGYWTGGGSPEQQCEDQVTRDDARTTDGENKT